MFSCVSGCTLTGVPVDGVLTLTVDAGTRGTVVDIDVTLVTGITGVTLTGDSTVSVIGASAVGTRVRSAVINEIVACISSIARCTGAVEATRYGCTGTMSAGTRSAVVDRVVTVDACPVLITSALIAAR